MPEIGTRALRLYVDGTEFTSSVSDVRIVAGEKDTDFVSFSEAAAGGAREYFLNLTLKQNTDTSSLWDYIWTQAGTDVAVVVWPNGQNTTNPATPTTTYPSVTGTVSIREPDGDLLGGTADKSTTARLTTSVAWPYTAKPTRATA